MCYEKITILLYYLAVIKYSINCSSQEMISEVMYVVALEPEVRFEFWLH